MASNGNDLPITSDNDKVPTQTEGLPHPIKETRQIVRTYVIVSHIAFVIITPLLLFVGGGTYIVRKYNLPSWLNIVFIMTGILVMLFSLISYLFQLLHLYGKDKGKDDKYRKYKTDPKDYDY